MVSGIDVKNPKSGRTRDLKPIRAVVTHLKTSFLNLIEFIYKSQYLY